MKEAILFLLIGVLIISILIFLLIKRWRLIRKGEKTVGTVVDYVEDTSDDDTYYHPVVEFTTRRGETLRQKYFIGTNPKTKKLGQKITIYYLPNNPQEFEMPAGCSTFLIYVALLSMGVLSFLIGVTMLTGG